MVIAGFLDPMCLALPASGLWLRYATLQNPPWRNPRKGRDQILPSGNLGGESEEDVVVSNDNGLSYLMPSLVRVAEEDGRHTCLLCKYTTAPRKDWSSEAFFSKQRHHPHMTSEKIWDFFTPPPFVRIWD